MLTENSRSFRLTSKHSVFGGAQRFSRVLEEARLTLVPCFDRTEMRDGNKRAARESV